MVYPLYLSLFIYLYISLRDCHLISSQHYLTHHDLDTRSTAILDCHVSLHGDVPGDIHRHLVHFEVVLLQARGTSISEHLEACSTLILDRSLGPILDDPVSQTDGFEMLLPTLRSTSFEILRTRWSIRKGACSIGFW